MSDMIPVDEVKALLEDAPTKARFVTASPISSIYKIAVSYVELSELHERLNSSVEFYKKRCEELQKVQSTMRDPERKMVCDILANGITYATPSKESE